MSGVSASGNYGTPQSVRSLSRVAIVALCVWEDNRRPVLWTHDGRHVGQFDGGKILGVDGRYLGSPHGLCEIVR
jgi:hypothetical protein